MRDAAVLKKPDNGWNVESAASRMNLRGDDFFSRGYALQNEYQCAACGADIDWLVTSV
jgi:hypothetical protein